MAVVAGKWVEQATGIGKGTQRVFKGYWPKAGDVILFDGGRSLMVVDASRGTSYTTGNANTNGGGTAVWTAWPPVAKGMPRALSVVRAHVEVEHIDGDG